MYVVYIICTFVAENMDKKLDAENEKKELEGELDVDEDDEENANDKAESN